MALGKSLHEKTSERAAQKGGALDTLPVQDVEDPVRHLLDRRRIGDVNRKNSMLAFELPHQDEVRTRASEGSRQNDERGVAVTRNPVPPGRPGAFKRLDRIQPSGLIPAVLKLLRGHDNRRSSVIFRQD